MSAGVVLVPCLKGQGYNSQRFSRSHKIQRVSLTFCVCCLPGSIANGTTDLYRVIRAPTTSVYDRLMRLDMDKLSLKDAGIENPDVFIASTKADDLIRVVATVFAHAVAERRSLVEDAPLREKLNNSTKRSVLRRSSRTNLFFPKDLVRRQRAVPRVTSSHRTFEPLRTKHERLVMPTNPDGTYPGSVFSAEGEDVRGVRWCFKDYSKKEHLNEGILEARKAERAALEKSGVDPQKICGQGFGVELGDGAPVTHLYREARKGMVLEREKDTLSDSSSESSDDDIVDLTGNRNLRPLDEDSDGDSEFDDIAEELLLDLAMEEAMEDVESKDADVTTNPRFREDIIKMLIVLGFFHVLFDTLTRFLRLNWETIQPFVSIPMTLEF